MFQNRVRTSSHAKIISTRPVQPDFSLGFSAKHQHPDNTSLYTPGQTQTTLVGQLMFILMMQKIPHDEGPA